MRGQTELEKLMLPEDRLPTAGEVRALSHQLMAWADHLAEWPAGEPADIGPSNSQESNPRERALALAEAMRDAARLRSSVFPIAALANPAWSILIDLTIRAMNGFRTSLHEIALGEDNLAPSVHDSVAALVEAGVVAKTPDELLGGVTWLTLTERGQAKMDRYLDALAYVLTPKPSVRPRPDPIPSND